MSTTICRHCTADLKRDGDRWIATDGTRNCFIGSHLEHCPLGVESHAPVKPDLGAPQQVKMVRK